MLPLPNEPELFSLEEVLLIERLTLDSTLEPAIPELEPILPLPARDDVRAMAVGVLEYAHTDFGDHAPVADEIVLGETPARDVEYGCGGICCSPPFRGTSVQAKRKRSLLVFPRRSQR